MLKNTKNKYNLRSDAAKIVEILIDKMLESNNITYQYILNNQMIDNVPWYSYYTITKEQEEEWINWCKDWLKNNITPKLSKEMIEKEILWLNLQYGLRVKNNENKD